MTLATGEFLRRFLLHILPTGLHRIRHYGLFTNAQRVDNLKRARALLAVEKTPHTDDPVADSDELNASTCPNCGAPMSVIETLLPCRHRPGTPLPLLRWQASDNPSTLRTARMGTSSRSCCAAQGCDNATHSTRFLLQSEAGSSRGGLHYAREDRTTFCQRWTSSWSIDATTTLNRIWWPRPMSRCRPRAHWIGP